MSSTAQIASHIDHTILKAGTTLADVERICQEAIEHQFAAVCVPPLFVSRVSPILENTGVRLATVVGFPLGYNSLSTKIFETEDALQNGANEIDLVVNLSGLKSGDWEQVAEEVAAISTLVKETSEALSLFDEEVLLKVIIETGMLSETEIRKVVEICIKSGVDFVKTSTGFNATGASVESVQLLRTLLPAEIRIKASGGIKTAAFAQELIDAGADRLGCSASLKIIGV